MFEVELYQLPDGSRPVEDWLESLSDERTAERIAARFARLTQGNFGDHKVVGGGVSELRFRFGPGYRVYYARIGRVLVLLLCGGDKASQQADIRRAAAYLADHVE